jgi:drug/metabolite transporter (DMT)-like permease
MYTNLMPVAAVLVTLWLGTAPTGAQLVGGGIILAGVLYAQLAARAPAPAARPVAAP